MQYEDTFQIAATAEEVQLLGIMKEVKFGDIVVRIRDGKPFMVDKITEKIALGKGTHGKV